MRIVAVGDTHTFEADLDLLPEGDLFVHVGDLCRGGTVDELAPVVRWIAALPHPHKVVVAGNHDWCFAREGERARALLGPTVHYLEDTEATIAGLRVWGSPWQPAFHDWAFNLPRGEALRAKWELIPEGIDLLLTHCPPRGFGDRSSITRRHGCHDLLAAVRRVRPALHLFGHIHEDGGLWRDGPVCLDNVTTWEGERGPTVLDLDRRTGRVIPIAVPPRQ
jgi:predicted phosphohydrolase